MRDDAVPPWIPTACLSGLNNVPQRVPRTHDYYYYDYYALDWPLGPGAGLCRCEQACGLQHAPTAHAHTRLIPSRHGPTAPSPRA